MIYMCVHVDINQYISVLCELIYTLSSNILNSNVVMLIIYFMIRNYSQPYPNCRNTSFNQVIVYLIFYFFFTLLDNASTQLNISKMMLHARVGK